MMYYTRKVLVRCQVPDIVERIGYSSSENTSERD